MGFIFVYCGDYLILKFSGAISKSDIPTWLVGSGETSQAMDGPSFED